MCMQKNGGCEKLPAFPYPTWYNGDSSKYKCGKCTPSCGLILSWEIVGKYEGEEKKQYDMISFSDIIIYKMNSQNSSQSVLSAFSRSVSAVFKNVW